MTNICERKAKEPFGHFFKRPVIMETAAFNVPSITCSVCSGKIQGELKGINGIGNVNVDLSTQQVNVEYDPNSVKPQDIKKRIMSMGFEVM